MSKKFLDLINKQRNEKKASKFKGTFLDYLSVIKDDPEKIMLAHKRLYKTVKSFGVETSDVGQRFKGSVVVAVSEKPPDSAHHQYGDTFKDLALISSSRASQAFDADWQ